MLLDASLNFNIGKHKCRVYYIIIRKIVRCYFISTCGMYFRGELREYKEYNK